MSIIKCKTWEQVQTIIEFEGWNAWAQEEKADVVEYIETYSHCCIDTLREQFSPSHIYAKDYPDVLIHNFEDSKYSDIDFDTKKFKAFAELNGFNLSHWHVDLAKNLFMGNVVLVGRASGKVTLGETSRFIYKIGRIIMNWDLKSIAVRFDGLEERMQIANKFEEGGIRCYGDKRGMNSLGWFHLDKNAGLGIGTSFEPELKIILTFTEFMNPAPKLENGMVVEYRNGDRRMVMEDTLLGSEDWGNISRFDDRYKCKNITSCDMVKLYKVKSFKFSFGRIFAYSNLTLVHDLELLRASLDKQTKKQELLKQIAELQKAVEEME